MNYVFVPTNRFKSDLKSLHKTNRNIDSDLKEFFENFDHKLGDYIAGTGGAQKIRMKVSGKGKSGGYRVIYFVKLEETVYLLTAYSKTQKEDLSSDDKKVISELIEQIKRM